MPIDTNDPRIQQLAVDKLKQYENTPGASSVYSNLKSALASGQGPALLNHYLQNGIISEDIFQVEQPVQETQDPLAQPFDQDIQSISDTTAVPGVNSGLMGNVNSIWDPTAVVLPPAGTNMFGGSQKQDTFGLSDAFTAKPVANDSSSFEVKNSWIGEAYNGL